MKTVLSESSHAGVPYEAHALRLGGKRMRLVKASRGQSCLLSVQATCHQSDGDGTLWARFLKDMCVEKR
jgi:hypothetical protein